MPRHRYCAAPGCPHAVVPKGPKHPMNYPGTMHCFPDKKKYPATFEEWVRFCERAPEWKPSQSNFVCDSHFVSDKKNFHGTQVPTIPAGMVAERIKRLEDLPSNLPENKIDIDEDMLIHTLPVLTINTDHEQKVLVTLEPENGLPRERTPDITEEHLENIEDLVVRSHKILFVDKLVTGPFLPLKFADVPLAKLPTEWSLAADQLHFVLFAQVDKRTTEIPRQVAVSPDLGNFVLLIFVQL